MIELDNDEFWNNIEKENDEASEKFKNETPRPFPKYQIGETVYYYDYVLLTEGKIRDIAYYWSEDRKYIDDGTHHYFKVVGGHWVINYKVTRKVTPYDENDVYKTRKEAEIANAKNEFNSSLKKMKECVSTLKRLGIDTYNEIDNIKLLN